MALGTQPTLAVAGQLLTKNDLQFLDGTTLKEHVPVGALGLDRLVFLVVLGFADQIGRLTALAFPGRRRRGLAGESHLELVSVRAQVTNDETIGEDDAVLRFEGLGADLHATQCAVCHNCLLDVVKKRVHSIGRVKPSRASHTHP